MFGTHDLVLFVASGLLLNLTPGPDTVYIVGRGSAQGLRAGVAAAFGICAGLAVHVLAAALGLSAILAASADAFAVVKLLGAAYLVWVGISLLRSTGSGLESPERIAPAATLRAVFLQGMLTNVLNPKVAIFFLAYLPQFVDDSAPSKPLAFLFLGAVFTVNGTLWNLVVAWSAARLAAGLGRSSAPVRWFNRCVGALFVYLGARLALDPGN